MNDIFLIINIFLILINYISNDDSFRLLTLTTRSIPFGYSEDHFSVVNAEKNNRSISDFVYTGTFKNIEKILYNSRNNIEKIKDENYPYVYIRNTCIFKDVKYFSNKTIFFINSYCDNNKSYFENYSDYTFAKSSSFSEYINKIEKSNSYYVKIGIISNNFKTYIILGVIFLINSIVGIICAHITSKRIKKTTILNYLPIYIINYNLYYALLPHHMFNLFVIFMTNPKVSIVAEYVFIFGQAFYKASFYSIILLVIPGWMILYFNIGRFDFKKYFLYIFIYDLGFSVFLNLSLFIIHITSKLNLYFFKTIMEQIVFISYLVYLIYKVLIPLYKQKKCEERKRSNLVECITFKYKKLFKLYLFLGIRAILIIIFPFIEHAILRTLLYDFQFHFILNIIYEVIGVAGLNFIFLSNRLPLYYFQVINFDFKDTSFLITDIVEDDDKNKLDISKLTSAYLNKALKEESPILFINPFVSTKDSFSYTQLQLGIAANNK